MADIKIAMIQSDLVWEDGESNCINFGNKIDSIGEPVDIIVLPEMFNTGFTMNPARCAEDLNGKTIAWLRHKAIEKNSVIIGSLIIKEESDYYNRLIWMKPDGSFQTYDKRHLFRLGNENNYYKQGKKKLIAELSGWRFCPLICYDLRFPVWSKNKLLQNKFQDSDLRPQTSDLNFFDYDCLIYIANWPVGRKHAWRQLLIARAIENQSYVIGVNRVGKDGNGITHPGGSIAVDFKGNVIYDCGEDKEDIHTVNLSYKEMEAYRKAYNFALDWDSFTMNNEQ